MKKACLILLNIVFAISGFGQKQTFDVISFSIPKGWQQLQNAGGVQLFINGNTISV